MDGMLYIKIMDKHPLPFLRNIFRVLNIVLYRMGSKASRVAKAYYQEKGTNWWPTPASSADFNSTELILVALSFVGFLQH